MPSKIVKLLSVFLLTNLIGLLGGCQELTLYKDHEGIYGFDPMTMAPFEVDAKNRFLIVHQFTQAEGKPLAVLRDNTSAFYGICQHRKKYVLFRYSQGKLSYLQSFSNIISDEFYPFKPVLASDHRLYIIVPQGKTPNALVLDACTLRGQCRVLHHFGRAIPSDLLLGHDGTLYGTAYYVVSRTKAQSGGLLFQYNHNTGFRILHRFQSVEGWAPGNLILGANGAIYGITGLKGRYGAGTLFEYDPRSRRFRVLYAFPKEDEGGVFLSAAGRNCLYGGSVGGMQGKGYLFSYDLKQDKMYVLHHFTSNEGVIGALVLGGDGNLYGTTNIGGKYKEGVLFQCSPQGRYRVLHVFNPSEGNGIKDTLIWSNARLYGTIVSSLETGEWLYIFDIKTHVLRSLHHFSMDSGNTA